MPLFLFGNLAPKIVVHASNAMKFMFYTYECMHGIQNVGCEFVMAAGVDRDTNVL